MTMRAKKRTKLITPFLILSQGPAYDEADWLPEGQVSRHLLGEWTRSLIGSERNRTKMLIN